MTAASETESLAALVVATAQRLNQSGINAGTSGNVSVRSGNAMLITPSRVAYDAMGVEDIVTMHPDTSWSAGNERRPSSEWRFHLDIYAARPDVSAVVHAHPVSATALAVHGRGIGPFHYMVGVAGGHDIRCADYATFGSQELSDNVVQALTGRKACLMAHHGLIAVGTTLDDALDLAIEVEVLAAQFIAASTFGEPPELTAAHMDEVLAKMASPDGYGSSPASPNQ